MTITAIVVRTLAGDPVENHTQHVRAGAIQLIERRACIRRVCSSGLHDQQHAVNLRPFGADLARRSGKLDEAFKTFLILGSAMIYAGVLRGPWGVLKNAAYYVGTGGWFLYVLAFLGIILVILPALFSLGVIQRKSALSFRRRFATLSTTLIPLGLMFWVAFSLSFMLTNATYLLATLSDPLGLGWNLIGTANTTWRPILTSMIAPAQTLILLGGLLWSALTAQKAAKAPRVSPIPVIGYCLMATLLMLWLLI